MASITRPVAQTPSSTSSAAAVAVAVPSSAAAETTAAPQSRGRAWLGAMPFILSHIAVLGAFWSGITWQAIVLAVVLFVVRMFGVTAGYHRYFAHRTFKTSRVFQFVLAFLAESSSQKGVLWWAAHHRDHHKHSDTERDVHSPVQRGFLYAHLGWIFDAATSETRHNKVRDLAKYPELRFLNRFWGLPPTLVAIACLLIGGWSGLFIGFFLSTVVVWHFTFFINSLAHVFGKRRFATADDSRNSLLLALLTFGEGWHNNHHHYMMSARQGFYWYEIDLTYYALRALAAVGIVWDLREVPDEVLEAGREADRAHDAAS